MNRSWLPPVLRGKILTSPGYLLAAAAVMLLFDLPKFPSMGMGVFGLHVQQLAALIAVLLLAPRRWAALLLMLPAACWLMPEGAFSAEDRLGSVCTFALTLIPLWAGVVVACPRKRRRCVAEEAADEDDKPA